MDCSSSSGDSASSALPCLGGNTIRSPALGDLLLTNEIGRGGYGVVYRALTMNGADPREFAVKCIYNPECNRRLENLTAAEFSLHSKCSKGSPNVLALVDVYIDDVGITYIITELCTGDLLEKIMKGDFQGNDELIRTVFLQIIDAVQACHDRGVYHRDLKPENIFWKKDGSCVLGDFGLATTSKRTKDFYTGSEPFMSPEVLGGIRNEQASFSSSRADIWALGVILLSLITSRLPWVRARAYDANTAMRRPPPGDYGCRCSFFERFLHSSENYFCAPQSHFGLSRAASNVLMRIFTTDPRQRIPLHELRSSVKAISTFYAKPEDHIADSVTKALQQPQNQPYPCVPTSTSDSDMSFCTDSSSMYSTSSDSFSSNVLSDIGGKWYHRNRYESSTIDKFPKVPNQEPPALSSPERSYIILQSEALVQPLLGLHQNVAEHRGQQDYVEARPNDRSYSHKHETRDSNASASSEVASSSDSDGPDTPETHAQYAGVTDIDEIDMGGVESTFINDNKPEDNVVLQITS